MNERQIVTNLIIVGSLYLSSCTPVAAADTTEKANRELYKDNPNQVFVPNIQINSVPQPLLKVEPVISQEVIFNPNIYLANNQKDATWVANTLGLESPSNMCGPLAAQILKDMGILPSDTKIKDYWIFNPEEKSERNKLFPSSEFEFIRIMEPVNRYDFSKNPLQVGDFVFLSGGSFGHMLAVTKIDNSGRAYSVTNIKQLDGSFKIEEIMLYDPNIPVNTKANLFYDSNKPDEPYFNNGWAISSPHGRTGINFYVWRKRK